MRNKGYLAATVLGLAVFGGAGAVGADMRTELISKSTAGVLGDGDSSQPAVSRNGRYVVFESVASNLVEDDDNGRRDIFLHDRTAGTTVRVSVSSNETEANGNSSDPAVSDTGRYVVFSSEADNLVSGDTNGKIDVFLRDVTAGTTSRVSVGPGGLEGDDDSGAYGAALSADGRYIAFESAATNLIGSDTNGYRDIFLHDRVAGATARINLSFPNNEEATGGDSIKPAITADGRYVAFETRADDLMPCDDNHRSDILVRDIAAKTTSIASVSAFNCISNGHSYNPSISDDGRYVVFSSDASDLLVYTSDEDTNGQRDIFIHDMVDETTERVSLSTVGEEGNNRSSGAYGAAMSSDGRYITFTSLASNLDTGDYNETEDIFVRDRTAAATTRESLGDHWEQGNGISERSTITSNGRFLAFESTAEALVTGDTNGRRDIFIRDYLYTGPMVRAIAPTSGSNEGGTLVTLTGGNFVSGTAVTFDGIPATNVFVVNGSQLTCIAPPHDIGPAPLVVSNPDGQEWQYKFKYVYRTEARPWMLLVLDGE